MAAKDLNEEVKRTKKHTAITTTESSIKKRNTKMMKKRVKKTKTIQEMQWSSLTAVKGYIERSVKGEKVLSFVGHTLITNKALYSLGPEGLNVTLVEPKK